MTAGTIKPSASNPTGDTRGKFDGPMMKRSMFIRMCSNLTIGHGKSRKSVNY